jgi:cytochrome c-type biogenesis protein CcmH/NrfF
MNKKKWVHLWLFTVLALLAAFMALPVLAQGPSADEINQVAKKLSCPTCTGINVADCPTETCAQWRTKIGEMLAECKGEQEILDYFAARYGDHVLQVPPKRGFLVLVWLLPVIAILAGLAWLAYLMRGWARRSALVTPGYPQDAETVKTSGSAADVGDTDLLGEDEYLRRVQQDLEKLS